MLDVAIEHVTVKLVQCGTWVNCSNSSFQVRNIQVYIKVNIDTGWNHSFLSIFRLRSNQYGTILKHKSCREPDDRVINTTFTIKNYFWHFAFSRIKAVHNDFGREIQNSNNDKLWCSQWRPHARRVLQKSMETTFRKFPFICRNLWLVRRSVQTFVAGDKVPAWILCWIRYRWQD